MTEYLYGLPGAEQLHDDPGTVWESEIDGQYDADETEWTVEQWTVEPAIDHVRSAALIVDDICEWLADDGYGNDGDSWRHPIEADPEVLALAEKLRQAIAAKLTWHWAGDLVRTLTLTLVDGAPFLDGEPMHRPEVKP